MLRMLVQNQVQDYGVFRRVFDETLDSLAPFWLRVEWIRRAADDPQQVWFCLMCESRERADAFLSDPGNADVGKRAGVVGGEVIYLDDC
jgi:hypothetical protein